MRPFLPGADQAQPRSSVRVLIGSSGRSIWLVETTGFRSRALQFCLQQTINVEDPSCAALEHPPAPPSLTGYGGKTRTSNKSEQIQVLLFDVNNNTW